MHHNDPKLIDIYVESCGVSQHVTIDKDKITNSYLGVKDAFGEELHYIAEQFAQQLVCSMEKRTKEMFHYMALKSELGKMVYNKATLSTPPILFTANAAKDGGGFTMGKLMELCSAVSPSFFTSEYKCEPFDDPHAPSKPLTNIDPSMYYKDVKLDPFLPYTKYAYLGAGDIADSENVEVDEPLMDQCEDADDTLTCAVECVTL
jgi:hypothetical protein